MPKSVIKVKKPTVVEVEFYVDSRVHNPDTIEYKTADAILGGGLDKKADELYSDDYSTAIRAVSTINETFEKADRVLEEIRKGKFEI